MRGWSRLLLLADLSPLGVPVCGVVGSRRQVQGTSTTSADRWSDYGRHLGALASIPTFPFCKGERALPRASVAGDDVADAWHCDQSWHAQCASSGNTPTCAVSSWAGLAYYQAACRGHHAGLGGRTGTGLQDGRHHQTAAGGERVAAIGAFLFGLRAGSYWSQTGRWRSLLMWIATVVIAYVWHTQTGFWWPPIWRTLSGRVAKSGGRALVEHPEPAAASCGVLGLWGLVVRWLG